MLTGLAHMGSDSSGMMGPGMMMWGPSAGSGWGVMGQGGFWVWSILSWLTWILLLVALIALIRWLWKKGNK